MEMNLNIENYIIDKYNLDFEIEYGISMFVLCFVSTSNVIKIYIKC